MIKGMRVMVERYSNLRNEVTEKLEETSRRIDCNSSAKPLVDELILFMQERLQLAIYNEIIDENDDFTTLLQGFMNYFGPQSEVNHLDLQNGIVILYNNIRSLPII